MTTRGITTRLGLGVASTMLGAAMLLGFQAPDDGTITRYGADPRVVAGTSGSSDTTTSGGSTPRQTASPASGAAVVDGPVVTTRYGPVQVEIRVSGGRLTGVTAIELPTGGHSGRISSEVAPILASEALAAQGASIDIVSGATYTSMAYERSLQAALDQAGI